MIRPTTIPQTLEELIIEHAVAREALRLGYMHHKFLARGLRGARPAEELETILFDRRTAGSESYIDPLKISLIGGTGGLLSHAPRRIQSSMMLIDAFQPEGITRLVQDSVFMMPHLGILSTVHPKAALEIFEKDCLVNLGACIAPKGLPDNPSQPLMDIDMNMPDGSTRTESLFLGDIVCVPLPIGQNAEVTIKPNKTTDIGAGSGRSTNSTVEGGVVGIILDGRGRPIAMPSERAKMKELLLKWFSALNMYPEQVFEMKG
jgi:hypothetical protein